MKFSPSDYDGKFEVWQMVLSPGDNIHAQNLPSVEKILQEATIYTVLAEDGETPLHYYEYDDALESISTSKSSLNVECAGIVRAIEDGTIYNTKHLRRTLRTRDNAVKKIEKHGIKEYKDIVYVYTVTTRDRAGHITTTQKILEPSVLKIVATSKYETLTHEDSAV